MNQFFTVLALFATLIFTYPVHAVTTPTFPSCINPQGSLQAYYTSGYHGIPGKPNELYGSDKVYQLNGDKTLQCFCPQNNQGIQTNWVKASNFSALEIEQLKGNGWIYINDGAASGLSNVPYLAQNTSFLCFRAVGGGELKSDTNVLGLASTGNIQSILVLGMFGISLLAAATFLKKV
ncbi:MAG: hypothetical protein AAB966_01930 [Patescibacteria group bacterium]